MGRQGEKNLQAEETELCLRMYQEYGQGVIYNENAEVGHKVFEYRTEKWWLLNRSFWQGYSKRGLETMISVDSTQEENKYLKDLFFMYVPLRIKSLTISPSLSKTLQLLTIFLFTATVGMGYLWGLVKW
jgi:hypothetical protein